MAGSRGRTVANYNDFDKLEVRRYHAYVMAWLQREFEERQLVIFSPQSNQFRSTLIGTDDDEWRATLTRYYDLAMKEGINTLRGRQAIAKVAACAIALTMTVVMEEGNLPRPGTKTGEVFPWA